MVRAELWVWERWSLCLSTTANPLSKSTWTPIMWLPMASLGTGIHVVSISIHKHTHTSTICAHIHTTQHIHTHHTKHTTSHTHVHTLCTHIHKHIEIHYIQYTLTHTAPCTHIHTPKQQRNEVGNNSAMSSIWLLASIYTCLHMQAHMQTNITKT